MTATRAELTLPDLAANPALAIEVDLKLTGKPRPGPRVAAPEAEESVSRWL
jgi:hypothetical protein